MDYQRDRLKWDGWGWNDHHFDLHGREQALWAFLQDGLGLDELVDTPGTPLDGVQVPSCRLSDVQLGALKGMLHGDRVKTDRYERIFHALGKSYHDLIRVRAGTLSHAPDAVVYPETNTEIKQLMDFAAAEGLALIPYGGGSSVVGGIEARADEHAGVLTIDMTRMNRVLNIDEESLTATVQAGIYGPALEAQFQERGLTLGHYPQSFQFSTLGGWIAARGSGQQSNRYGAAAKFLVGSTVVTPSGVLKTRPFPQSAAGPDLNHVVAGSEGRIGVIVEATVRLHSVPSSQDYRGFLYPDFEMGAEVIRALMQEHVDVAMLRLSDAGETFFLGQFKSFGKPESWLQKAAGAALEFAGVGKNPCLLLVGMEGTSASVAASRISVARICLGGGGVPLGPGPGRGWYATRFEMPYLRDALLNRGVGVDTLETATHWSNIQHLHRVVKKQLVTSIKRHSDRCKGEPIVMAHISHSYHTGASLYFTFVFPIALGDPLGQWTAIKKEVSDVILANAGTISHHHGVGRDHRPWMRPEKGELGVQLLQSACAGVDPTGMMNPGKLIPN